MQYVQFMKTVISGGLRQVILGNFDSTDTEVHDPTADAWSNIPSMTESSFDHSPIAVTDKLFVAYDALLVLPISLY